MSEVDFKDLSHEEQERLKKMVAAQCRGIAQALNPGSKIISVTVIPLPPENQVWDFVMVQVYKASADCFIITVSYDVSWDQRFEIQIVLEDAAGNQTTQYMSEGPFPVAKRVSDVVKQCYGSEDVHIAALTGSGERQEFALAKIHDTVAFGIGPREKEKRGSPARAVRRTGSK